MTDSRNSNILEIYMIGQTAETVILWGISDRTDNRNSNIVGLYMISQATKSMWSMIFFFHLILPTVLQPWNSLCH